MARWNKPEHNLKSPIKKKNRWSMVWELGKSGQNATGKKMADKLGNGNVSAVRPTARPDPWKAGHAINLFPMRKKTVKTSLRQNYRGEGKLEAAEE